MYLINLFLRRLKSEHYFVHLLFIILNLERYYCYLIKIIIVIIVINHVLYFKYNNF